jgi:hypothetical protein
MCEEVRHTTGGRQLAGFPADAGKEKGPVALEACICFTGDGFYKKRSLWRGYVSGTT